MKHDKLKCLNCGKEFIDYYPDIQDGIMYNCPQCHSNRYINTDKIKRQQADTNLKRQNHNDHINSKFAPPSLYVPRWLGG